MSGSVRVELVLPAKIKDARAALKRGHTHLISQGCKNIRIIKAEDVVRSWDGENVILFTLEGENQWPNP